MDGETDGRMDIVERIRADYQRFPDDQSYDLYADEVYFKDPLNEFHGVDRYRKMIGTLDRWLQDIQLQLHSIEATDPQRIETHWTLSWRAPLPWHPQMSVPGWSELKLNQAGQICAHIDYWNCSRWEVLRQLIPRG